MSRLDAYDAELRRAGIPRARRSRIVAELADHLACDPEARLGDPAELARQFADELGTALARRAAYSSFLALVPLGILFAALFGFTAVYTTSAPLVLTLALVVGIQLAFVGGVLAVLRAWRLRRAAVVPAAEARVLLRRGAVGLAGGGITVAALALLASGYYREAQWSQPAFAWVTVGVGAAAVVAGAVAVVRGRRLLPLADGSAADLAFDLGVSVNPWRLALAIAGGLALCIALAGLVQADPLDGLVRAVGDGLLCLAGFAVLGRPLGLRT
jgi:hypothetical protein